MWCICYNIDVKIEQKLGDVSDAVILWYFDAWQEWENIPKETYTRFNQSLWSVPAARWSDKILGPAFLLTMLNTTNWLLFIRFSCHQLWRCLHRSAPRRCARPGRSRAAADKWQAMHQKISSGKKRPPLAGKNCLTLMLLMHRTSSFCNLDLDVPSRLPKLLYCVECGGADIRWRVETVERRWLMGPGPA